MKIAQMIASEFPEGGASSSAGQPGGKHLSGIGGVDSGEDAAEFILLGCNTVQVRVDGMHISRKPKGSAVLPGTTRSCAVHPSAQRRSQQRPPLATSHALKGCLNDPVAVSLRLCACLPAAACRCALASWCMGTQWCAPCAPACSASCPSMASRALRSSGEPACPTSPPTQTSCSARGRPWLIRRRCVDGAEPMPASMLYTQRCATRNITAAAAAAATGR